jgi:hypothetical protein
MSDYKSWVIKQGNKLKGRSHEDWLEDYTRFLFGNFPYHATGNPLFIHGNIEPGTGCRKQVNLIDGADTSVTIFKNDPIIVEVIGVNYIIGDHDRQGNIIQNEGQIARAFDFEESMHSPGKVGFKKITDVDYTNLSPFVVKTRTSIAFPFEASPYNPYLQKWDIPMPVGDHMGAMASQLLLLQIPEEGEYLLKFEARSFFDYESCALYQINVIPEDKFPPTLNGTPSALKDRYSDIKDKVGSVMTSQPIKNI